MITKTMVEAALAWSKENDEADGEAFVAGMLEAALAVQPNPVSPYEERGLYDQIMRSTLETGHLTPEHGDSYGRLAVQLRRLAVSDDFSHPEIKELARAKTEPAASPATEPAPAPVLTMPDRVFAREVVKRLNLLCVNQAVARTVWALALKMVDVETAHAAEVLQTGHDLRLMGLLNALVGERVSEGSKVSYGLLTLHLANEVSQKRGEPLLRFSITDEDMSE